MSAEPVEEVFKKIMDMYNRNTEGWSVLADDKGNVLVLGPRIGYRMKLIPLNPYECTGVGLRVERLNEWQRMVKGTPSWGLRPLSGEEATELLSALHSGGRVENEVIRRILDMKPVPTTELEGDRPEVILSGPILAPSDLSAISKGQRELEAKLATEADRLFRRRYPSRAAIYG